MKCVILAAGKGTRLSHISQSKPLTPLLGKSLIEHQLSNFANCGISQFIIVTGFESEKVKKHILKSSIAKNLDIVYVYNDEWEKENGISLQKTEFCIQESFLLTMADHVFQSDIISNFIRLELQASIDVILAVDFPGNHNHHIDIEDVTKVQLSGNKILNLGKKLRNFHAYDTGLFMCKPTIFEAICRSSSARDSSLSGAVRILADRCKVEAFNIGNRPWFDIDTEQDLVAAEKKLQEYTL